MLGVSGSSNDIRQLLILEDKGDKRAKLALAMLVYRIQQAIGQMVASMNGANCLVLTGTVGERSGVIRSRIIKGLSYLNFECDRKINLDTFEPDDITNVATDSSKPILIIKTDEAAEIAHRVELYINKQK